MSDRTKELSRRVKEIREEHEERGINIHYFYHDSVEKLYNNYLDDPVIQRFRKKEILERELNNDYY